MSGPPGRGLQRQPRVSRRGFAKERLPAFDRIPTSKLGVVPLIFLFARARRSVAVFTEAHGRQAHHGRAAMLINEHSASAAEMVAAFASEYRLARLAGVKTAGRLVATSASKAGMGSRLVLPVALYYTWNGANLEGNGAVPTVEEPVATDRLVNDEDNQLARASQCCRKVLPLSLCTTRLGSS